MVEGFTLRDHEIHTGVPGAPRPIIEAVAVRRGVSEGSIDKPRVRHSVDQFPRTDPFFVALFGPSGEFESFDRGSLLHVEIEICEPVIIVDIPLRTNRCLVPAKGSTCAKAHS